MNPKADVVDLRLLYYYNIITTTRQFTGVPDVVAPPLGPTHMLY